MSKVMFLHIRLTIRINFWLIQVKFSHIAPLINNILSLGS